MCVIIGLSGNQVLPFSKLKNAALNNPDGFGIVDIIGTEMNVRHRFNPKGNDPEEVARELEKRKGADLIFLHLRYATKGEKNIENTHPFTVFKTKDHRIEFMHNGSMTRKVNYQEQKKSDSRQFTENFLSPLLERWHGENGVGDIEDTLLNDLLEEYFSYTNRGLLISNKLDPLFLGKWETTKGEDDADIVVSNTNYFTTGQPGRMTEFYKPKTENIPAIIHRSTQGPQGGFWSTRNNNSDKSEVGVSEYPLGTAQVRDVKMEPAYTNDNTANTSNTTKDGGSTAPTQTENKGIKTVNNIDKNQVSRFGRPITPLKDIDLSKVGRFLQPSDLAGLYDLDAGTLDDELIQQIAFFSLLEFNNFVAVNPDGAGKLLEHIFCATSDLIDKYEALEGKYYELQEKHRLASNMIGELKTKAA